jgi:hypothetical protein
MATAFQIKVGHNNVGLCGMKQSEAVATKVSELLQADMEASIYDVPYASVWLDANTTSETPRLL